MESFVFVMFFLIMMDLGLNIYSLVLIASDYRKDGE